MKRQVSLAVLGGRGLWAKDCCSPGSSQPHFMWNRWNWAQDLAISTKAHTVLGCKCELQWHLLTCVINSKGEKLIGQIKTPGSHAQGLLVCFCFRKYTWKYMAFTCLLLLSLKFVILFVCKSKTFKNPDYIEIKNSNYLLHFWPVLSPTPQR